MKTEVEARIEELLRKGERWNIIAKTLRVSKTTILKVSKRLNEETSPISATEVITMFKEGKSPEDIMIEYNANPVTIAEWFDAWHHANKRWRARQRAEESMAKAQEKGGEEAEEVEEAKKVEEEPRWKQIIKKEPPFPFR